MFVNVVSIILFSLINLLSSLIVIDYFFTLPPLLFL
nr:MAG TPA: hypothetical protein [Caudoviricetes sp.]